MNAYVFKGKRYTNITAAMRAAEKVVARATPVARSGSNFSRDFLHVYDGGREVARFARTFAGNGDSMIESTFALAAGV